MKLCEFEDLLDNFYHALGLRNTEEVIHLFNTHHFLRFWLTGQTIYLDTPSTVISACLKDKELLQHFKFLLSIPSSELLYYVWSQPRIQRAIFCLDTAEYYALMTALIYHADPINRFTENYIQQIHDNLLLTQIATSILKGQDSQLNEKGKTLIGLLARQAETLRIYQASLTNIATDMKQPSSPQAADCIFEEKQPAQLISSPLFTKFPVSPQKAVPCDEVLEQVDLAGDELLISPASPLSPVSPLSMISDIENEMRRPSI